MTRVEQSPCGGDEFYCVNGIRIPVMQGHYSTVGTPTTRTEESQCGGNAYYCAGGVRSLVSIGYYSTGGIASTRTGQAECEPGSYCVGGVSTECPGGTFGLGHRQSSCGGNCSAGYFCPPGSTSATYAACGGDAFYCPAGVASPLSVSIGHYSTGGTSSTHTGQSQCAAGTYCAGGVSTECPGGTFGSGVGLVSSSCSGPCRAGHNCPAGSTNATQLQCGGDSLYCPPGVGSPFLF